MKERSLVVRYAVGKTLLHIVQAGFVIALGYWMLWLGKLFAYIMWTGAAIVIAPGLPRLIDRRPLLRIDRHGITLHCADDLFLPHGQFHFWSDRGPSDSRVLCIQCIPRETIRISPWARINGIGVDLVHFGDIYFSNDCLDISPERVVNAIENFGPAADLSPASQG